MHRPPPPDRGPLYLPARPSVGRLLRALAIASLVLGALAVLAVAMGWLGGR